MSDVTFEYRCIHAQHLNWYSKICQTDVKQTTTLCTLLYPPMAPYLYMSLRLHEASHHTKAGVELTGRGVGGHARDDGVVGALARSDAVGVGGIQGEISTAIL